jgi:hypothetical protein
MHLQTLPLGRHVMHSGAQSLLGKSFNKVGKLSCLLRCTDEPANASAVQPCCHAIGFQKEGKLSCMKARTAPQTSHTAMPSTIQSSNRGKKGSANRNKEALKGQEELVHHRSIVVT